MSFTKNQAVTGFTFGLVSAADGSPITSGTVNGFVTIDGGTQSAIAGSATHEGNGQWSVNLTAAEMNGDVIGLVFTATGAIPCYFTISTGVDVTSVAGDADAATYLRDQFFGAYSGTIVNAGFGNRAFELDAGASSVDDRYVGGKIILTGGTGAGQVRAVTDYTGASRVGVVDTDWDTNPDATTTYLILPREGLGLEYIASAVWDASILDHLIANTFGSVIGGIFNNTVPTAIRAALGLSADDLDSQLAGINTNIDANEVKLDSVITTLSTAAVDVARQVLKENFATLPGPIPDRCAVNALRPNFNKWEVDDVTNAPAVELVLYAEDDTTEVLRIPIDRDANGAIVGFRP